MCGCVYDRDQFITQSIVTHGHAGAALRTGLMLKQDLRKYDLEHGTSWISIAARISYTCELDHLSLFSLLSLSPVIIIFLYQ